MRSGCDWFEINLDDSQCSLKLKFVFWMDDI